MKKEKPAVNRIYFTKDEAKAISLGLERVMEDIIAAMNDPLIPFTPEARSINRDILKNSASAAKKIEKYAGVRCELPDYELGDEDEFLTKES